MQFPRRRPEQKRRRRGTERKPCTTIIIQVFSSHATALVKTVTACFKFFFIKLIIACTVYLFMFVMLLSSMGMCANTSNQVKQRYKYILYEYIVYKKSIP
jgi:hypothetical protein